MQDDFADFFRMEVPPDDLLVNDFSDEMFDMEDYLNELIPDNIDTGRPQSVRTGLFIVRWQLSSVHTCICRSGQPRHTFCSRTSAAKA